MNGDKNGGSTAASPDSFVGHSARFSKTVGEFDVYQFAGVSGDFSPNHVDAEYMQTTRYGQRVAHGVLSVAYMSTCSTKVAEALGRPSVSAGYDRVRFIRPVFIGDTLTINYTVTSYDPEVEQFTAAVEVRNQRGEVVSVATHLLRLV